MSRRGSGDGVVADRRGVSSTVAFVLVFALMISSIAVVTTIGFDALRDVQRSEQAIAASRAMASVGQGVDAIAAGERPTDATRLDLSGGRLSVVNETAVEVTVTGVGVTRRYRPQGLRYTSGGRHTTYESGLLVRGTRGGQGLVLERPAMRCGDDHATLTVVELVPVEEGSSVGGGGVTVAVERQAGGPTDDLRPLEFAPDDSPPQPTGVDVTVDGPLSGAWQQALEARGFTSTGPGAVTCPVDRVFVRHVGVQVELST